VLVRKCLSDGQSTLLRKEVKDIKGASNSELGACFNNEREQKTRQQEREGGRAT
jgi:hypothetical protein